VAIAHRVPSLAEATTRTFSIGDENLLTVIQDPTDEEHQSMIEWLGGRFDPDIFDPSRVKFDDPAHRYKLTFEASRAFSGAFLLHLDTAYPTIDGAMRATT